MCDARQLEIDSILNVVNDTEKEFESFATQLRWNKNKLVIRDNGNTMVACSINSGHSAPAKTIDDHHERCYYKSKGYTTEEMESKIPSSNFFYAKSTLVVPVIIDKKLQSEILTNSFKRDPIASSVSGPRGIKQGTELENFDVPLTLDRCVTDLTQAERLAIYNYVVEKGKATKKENNINLDDLNVNFDENSGSLTDKPKSQLELMAELRDYKRRRQSYRAKNVHITKKSYTEVMREVIESQCRYLEDVAKPIENIVQSEELVTIKKEVEEKVEEEEAGVSQRKHHHKHRNKKHKKTSHRKTGSDSESDTTRKTEKRKSGKDDYSSRKHFKRE